MPQILELHPAARELMGFIPMFISHHDPRPAREQFNERYAHGGGWHPLPKWERNGNIIQYPGDEALKPVAKIMLRDETIYVYPSAWVMIVQPDGTYEVARMD